LAGEGCEWTSRRPPAIGSQPPDGRPSIRPLRLSRRSWPRANPESRGYCGVPRRSHRQRPCRSAPGRSVCSSWAASRAGSGGR